MIKTFLLIQFETNLNVHSDKVLPWMRQMMN